MTQQQGLRSAETKPKPTPTENTRGPPCAHPGKDPLPAQGALSRLLFSIQKGTGIVGKC